LDQVSGGVVGVGLCSAIKAFFFDQTFVAVFVAQEVSAGGLSTHCGHGQLFATAVDPAMQGKKNSRKGKKQDLTPLVVPNPTQPL